MLITQHGHELPSFPFISEPGTTTWRAVTLNLAIPYILVNCDFKQGRGWLSQTSVLWKHEDVLQFCQDVKSDRSRRILDIFLLLPAHHASGPSWRLAQVKAIFGAPYEGTGLEPMVYVTVDEKIIPAMGRCDPEAVVRDGSLEKIYSIAKTRLHATLKQTSTA